MGFARPAGPAVASAKSVTSRMGSACALLLGLFSFAAEAGGQTVGRTAPLAEGCPSAAFFRAELSARLSTDLRALALAQSFEVQVRAEPGAAGVQYVGTLRSSLQSLAEPSTPIVGSQCTSVLRALSLLAALSAERAARDLDAAAAAEAPATALPVLDRAAPTIVAPRDEGTRSSAGAYNPVRMTVGPLLLLQTAVSSGLSPDVGAFLALRFERLPLTPTVVLGASLSAPATVAASGTARVRLERETLHGQACAATLLSAPGFDVQPCATLDVGQLHARGSGLDLGWERTAPWLAVGGSLRAAWQLKHWAQLSAELGASAPLMRPYFYFRPDLVAFSVAPFGARAAVSLGARF
jgi:hypothetical protein